WRARSRRRPRSPPASDEELLPGFLGRGCLAGSRFDHGRMSATTPTATIVRGRLDHALGTTAREPVLGQHVGLDACVDIGVVGQELLGVLATLADAITLVAQPRAGLVEH